MDSALSDFCEMKSLFVNIIYLMLVLQLFHSAKINGYEALIVLIHSCHPSSNQIRTLFWYLLGGLGRTVSISARSIDNLGTLIERTSTALSSSKGNSIWHDFTVPLYYMWSCCYLSCFGCIPQVAFWCKKVRRVKCLTLPKN